MQGHKAAVVTSVTIAALACAGVAPGQQRAATTSLTLPAAQPGKPSPAVVLVNPGRDAITARLTIRSLSGGAATVRDVALPATTQRVIRPGSDFEDVGSRGPAAVSVECLDDRGSVPCLADSGVLAYLLPDALGAFERNRAARWQMPAGPWAAMTWIESDFRTRAITGAAADLGWPLPGGGVWPWTRTGSPFVSGGGFPESPQSPSGDWYFAEGFTGGGPFPLQFSTDFVVRNPDGLRAARVELTFARFRGDPVTRTMALAPGDQSVVRALDIPELENTSFAVKVTSLNRLPVLAWRIVQWGPPPAPPEAWSAASWTALSVHGGVRRPAERWAFPVVSAGKDVDVFFPVFNPTERPLRLRLTLVREDGSGTRFLASGWISPMSRFTVSPVIPSAFAGRCPCTAFLESIPADQNDEPVPFVAESSVYWPRGYWYAGVTVDGTPWPTRVAQPPVSAPRPLGAAQRRRIERAPAANVASWIAAALALGLLALWQRQSRGRVNPTAPHNALDARLTLVAGLGVAAVVWPTSIGGNVSRLLNVVAILGTAAALGAAVVLPGGRGSRVAVGNAAVIMGLLGVATAFTPLTLYSPGVVFIYLGISLLLVLDLRDLRPGRGTMAAFAAIHVVIVGFGLGTLLGIEPINRVLVACYSYYRPELVREMIADHKPVAVFITHSMAGFVIYLLGAAALIGTWRGPRWWILAGAYLVLLAGIRSTTSNILFGLAAAQAAWLASRQFPALRRPMLVAAALGAASFVIWLLADWPAGADRLRALVAGDRIHGFLVRFGPDGLMQENLEFLRRYPLAPIGFGLSDQLYLGDCGIVVTLLRGGLPAALCVYLGLFAFFRRNVHGKGAAMWLWLVTTGFEIGFQPLQAFRFVGLLPLYVVCLNALITRRAGDPDAAGGATTPP